MKKIPISLDEAKKMMLNVLSDFNKICNENGLQYWLTAGSLLGAVRHDGFIPWDDDIDIAMPKSHYQKLIDLEYPDYFFFQSKKTDCHFRSHYGKLRIKDSLFIEKKEKSKDIKYHQGIFIDIFPVNYVDSKHFNFYRKIHYLVLGLTADRRFYSKYFKNYLGNWASSFLDIFHNDSNDLVIFPYGTPEEQLRPTLKSSIFPLKLHNFEDQKFPIPCDSHAALLRFYGDDYMTLPPEDKRRVHHEEIFLLEE